MATYDNLPVYKVSYDLLLHLFQISKNMDRDYRFTIGESLKNEMVQLILNVYRANCRESKLDLITAARENIEVARLLLRLLNDLKQLGLKEFVSANERIESISKQLSAWSASQSKQSTAQPKKNKLQDRSQEGSITFPECAD